jgi:DNA repair protein RecO (recombination protein O)
MLQKTRGIVLHSLKYGDNGLVTAIYTEAFGRMSFIMQGIHGKKSPVKANLLRQLSLLEMEVDYKPGRELQRVREVKNISPFGSIPFGIVKSSQALFLAELLHKVLREEESGKELFEFLFQSIQVLDLMEDGTSNFHLLFLIQLTRYLGFAPTRNYSDSNQYFDMIAGTFVLTPPSHPWFLTTSLSAMLSRLLEVSFRNLPDFKPETELRDQMLNVVLDYYGIHLGNPLHLKSLAVLKEVLHS